MTASADSVTNTPAHHKSFNYIRSQYVASLNLTVQEFEHKVTGAKHYHLAADNQENVFLVALRTVPQDSRGVAHILEHTALCGSDKYPVRDPFFMMTRRSLNTFMNAFTSSDWTAYPFASMNSKDYNNLLDVYLDAVFFSRLDPLDFAQEGHRLEFETADDPSSKLVYKGVVFNEMKGAMSSVPSQLWQTLTKYLFPNNTYHHNSGGDPEAIPDLTYEQLITFYKTHYHPSNAIFMTYGDKPAAELQEKFETQALCKFERLDKEISVPDEKRYYAPVKVQESYPYTQADAADKHHVVLGWLLGKSTNLQEALQAQLLSSVLMDNSATPLMHALESTELGSSPSPICGLDDSQKELTFICGLEGCQEGSADDVEQLIESTLRKVAEEGIPQEDVESALHQLELHQREVGGDSYPFGLQLIMTALTAATHRGDPVKLLDVDAALDQLREDIKQPNFIKTLIEKWLLNNPHKVRLTLSPNAELQARKEQAELDKLAQIQANLTEEDKQNIVELAHALKKRQDQIDDESILPKVTLSDVPAAEDATTGETTTLAPNNPTPVTRYSAGTNGLVYQQLIYPLPQFSPEQLNVLPLYNTCITELGLGEKDYLNSQRWQASVTGGLSAFSSIRGDVNDPHKLTSYYAYSGKALNRNQAALSDVLKALIETPRFDETGRIAELVSQIRAHREQSVTGSGHSLAMAAASSGICAAANLQHNWSGLAGIKALKQLDDGLRSEGGLEALSNLFTSIHESITASQFQALLIGEQAHLDEMQAQLAARFTSNAQNPATGFDLGKQVRQVNDAWLTDSQVNFCSKAYATVPMDHPDAAALVVLAGVMRNSFLHKAIREQGGAYGGGASQDSTIGAFRFYSYRDPRLEETLADFDRSVEWAITENHDRQKVEEAILGTIGSLDRSESPAGKAKRCFYQELHGRPPEVRQRFRERILAVEASDLRRVAELYLKPDNAHIAVVTDFSKKDKMEAAGLTIQTL